MQMILIWSESGAHKNILIQSIIKSGNYWGLYYITGNLLGT